MGNENETEEKCGLCGSTTETEPFKDSYICRDCLTKASDMGPKKRPRKSKTAH